MKRGQKSRNGFKFGTFIGCFQSDGTASMAVKGVNLMSLLSFHYVASYMLKVRGEKKRLKLDGRGKQVQWSMCN